ncbi:MAG: hypothetical protein A2W93_05305 [Bacteroidetes bacterium GWF2_43_63]|nr:MAG: hypothetical protein A2W94_11845 [Bacteroidetes bacterium GWE2_42_42]OFY56291.1 MAG: hypothetical protein A2W93_05305 [Bacteroidetes bacterium GWF2_43_63]HBG71971.1 hypothetical protein [Bacteroidales bacterium]HCB61872.1 hypothetical protein [Bacteroidales bacterium]HCY23894.1 hypothetical protein [Bacteroidales bacterium]
MKTLVLITLMTVTCTAMFAQQIVDSFTKINVTGDIEITVKNGDEHGIFFSGSEASRDGLIYNISGGVLNIDATKMTEAINMKITAPVINEISLSSVSQLHSEGIINTQKLKLTSEGAAEFRMDLQCETLSLDLQGASEAWLGGNVNHLIAQLKGAAEVHAYELSAKSAEIYTEGASSMRVTVTDSLKATGSGASEIAYEGTPTNVDLNIEGVASIKKRSGESVGSALPDENANNQTGNCAENDDDKSREFNGHWAGVDLMMNSFVSKYGDINTTPGYDFMETDLAKSIGAQINFMEFNIPFVEKEKMAIGLTTGLGWSMLNYRLQNDVRLINDSAVLMAYSDTVSNTTRSKLTTSYLIMPLMLEFNTSGEKKDNGFHLGVGAFGGVRLGTHSKVVIDDRGDKDKFKSNGSFHLNPFKYGLMVRMGWGPLNLFANYALSEMFEKNEGPAVYPVEFGLSFDIN